MLVTFITSVMLMKNKTYFRGGKMLRYSFNNYINTNQKPEYKCAVSQ